MNRIIKTTKGLHLAKLLVAAVFLRLLVMPFYFHPDIKTFNFQAHFLQQGVTDIYSYLAVNKSKLPLKDEFVYFPLTYFFLGSYQWFASPFLGSNFTTWVSNSSQTANEAVGVFRYLFILKLPYLLFDLGTAFLLMSLFEEDKKKRQAFIFWLFNPFSIFIIYAFGNFDIIPVFLTIASLVLARKQHLVASSVVLGTAVAFKMYPLLFLPFLILEGRNMKERVWITFGGVGVFLLTIIPFLGSKYFWQSALVSGLTTRMIYPDFGIGFGESIMVAVAALSILYFYRLAQYRQGVEIIWKYFLAAMLLLFSLIHYHIQWLLWFLPLLIIFIVIENRAVLSGFLLMSAACLVPFFYDDKYMSVSLLSAISGLYDLVPTPFVVAQKLYDPFLIQSIFHSILLGGSLVIIRQLFRYGKI